MIIRPKLRRQLLKFLLENDLTWAEAQTILRPFGLTLTIVLDR